MPLFLYPTLSREHYGNAIVQPNPNTANRIEFRKLTGGRYPSVYTDVYEQVPSVKRSVYTADLLLMGLGERG
jgi:hypothetical protein